MSVALYGPSSSFCEGAPISLPTSTSILNVGKGGTTIIKPEEGLTCRHLLPQLVPYIKRLMILSTYSASPLPIRLPYGFSALTLFKKTWSLCSGYSLG